MLATRQGWLIENRLGLLALLALAFLLGPWAARPVAASTSCQGTPITVGNDTIYFVQVSNDFPVVGQSTWYYCVQSGASPNISHTNFVLNLGCLNLPAGTNSAGTWGPLTTNLSPGSGHPEIGTDGSTGLAGLKFDEEIPSGQTRNYYFTVDGNYATDMITAATKAGTGFDTALVPGPSGTCDLGADFGDLPNAAPAPVNYGNTILMQDGARHYFLSTGDVWLGLDRDADSDGQPDLLALGDDFADGNDDEDGVLVMGDWKTGSGAVSVAASGPGCVSGWLDWWNGAGVYGSDGDFADGSEQIVVNQPVAAGSQIFNFSLAANAVNDQTLYARFRIVPRDNGACNANTALAVNGSARGGEVEDYAWSWSPMAVGLKSAETARPSAAPLWLALALFGLSAVSAATLTLRRRPA